MSDRATLLSLPEEILVIILREHFTNTRVTIYPALQDNERKERYPRQGLHSCLNVLFACKKLHRLASSAFLENALFHHEGNAVSHDFNFWNQFRTGFPAEQFRHVSGDIDFALLLKKYSEEAIRLYSCTRKFTLMDTLYLEVDDVDDILDDIVELQTICRKQAISVKCYLVVTDVEPECWTQNYHSTTRIVVRRDGELRLYSIKTSSERQFDLIKRHFDHRFKNQLFKPMSCGMFRARYPARAIEWMESSKWVVPTA